MDRYERQKGLINQEKLKEVLVIGVGSIGSTVVQDLAMMGFQKIMICDMDIVSIHNLSTTRYNEDFKGMLKTDAAKEMITLLNSSTEVITYNGTIEDLTDLKFPENVIICTDSMSSREWIYNMWKESDSKNLIDIRMSAMVIERIITTKTKDVFKKYWVSDDEIPDDPCTAKHTVFTTSVASGLVVTGLFSVITERPYFTYINLSLCPTILKKEGFYANTGRKKDA